MKLIVGTTFELKLAILILWTKFAWKRYFGLEQKK